MVVLTGGGGVFSIRFSVSLKRSSSVTDVLQFEAAGPLRLQKTKYLPTDLQVERKVTSLRNIDEHSILFQMLTNEVLRLDYAIQNALDNGTGYIGP